MKGILKQGFNEMEARLSMVHTLHEVAVLVTCVLGVFGAAMTGFGLLGLSDALLAAGIGAPRYALIYGLVLLGVATVSYFRHIKLAREAVELMAALGTFGRSYYNPYVDNGE
jgi:hypothetical protein